MKAKDAHEANELVAHINALEGSAKYIREHAKGMTIYADIRRQHGENTMTTARIATEPLAEALLKYREDLIKRAEKLGVEFAK